MAGSPALAKSFTDQQEVNLHFDSADTITGSQTSALSSASPGTVSSAIDLETSAGIAVQCKGTNAALVDVEFSAQSGSNFRKAFTLYANDNYVLKKRARYVRFRSTSTNAPAGTLDVDYILTTAPAGGLPAGAATEATLSAINTKLVTGTDIGDVTVNNAAGASAVNIQDGGNSITVDGTVSAATSPPSGTSATEVQGTAPDASSPIGDPVLIGGVTAGGLVQQLRVDNNGGLVVGLNATPADGISNIATNLLSQGGAGSPMSVFPFHYDGSTNWNRMRGSTAHGLEVDVKRYPFETTTQGSITLTNTTETTLIAAGGAGVNNRLSYVLISNGSAEKIRVDFRDATGGAVDFSIWAGADGGGASMAIPVDIEQDADNNAWTAQLSSTPTENDVRIFAIARPE